MKLGIVVNVMDSDEAGATTYRLAADAINKGHEVWVMSTGNLAYNPDETIGAFARTLPPGSYRSDNFLGAFKSNKAVDEWITFDDLDALGSAQKFEKVDFTHSVLAALERKVEYMKYNRRNFSNLELATL